MNIYNIIFRFDNGEEIKSTVCIFLWQFTLFHNLKSGFKDSKLQ